MANPLAIGDVAALANYQDAIDLARLITEELPHVLAVGNVAEPLVREFGFPHRDLLTAEAGRSSERASLLQRQKRLTAKECERLRQS
jgi:isoaspartyl peptidase/L-asparaginase-like protein (Ntn-hydrolase superfamily)